MATLSSLDRMRRAQPAEPQWALELRARLAGDARADMAEHIAEFLDATPQLMHEIERALRTSDLQALEGATERLAAACLVFGARDLGALLDDLRQRSRTAAPASPESTLGRLTGEYARVRSVLENLRGV